MPAMVRCRWSTFAMGLLSVVLVGAIALVAEQSPPKKDQTGKAAKSSQAAGAAQKAAPAQAAPGEYVGDDAKCLECHDDHPLKGTVHGREFKDRSPVKN